MFGGAGLGIARRHHLRSRQLSRTDTPSDPADPGQLAAMLERHHIRPRHRLGQNFLIDPGVRDRLVQLAGVKREDNVLEVGAGLGALTIGLAPRCQRLVATEVDRRLAQVLRGVVAGFAGVEVLTADILRLELAAFFPGGGHLVCGNIPYYLTGALLQRLLEDPPRPRRLSLVVQREVADRWTGRSGWSLATVVVHSLTTPRLELELPPGAFFPEPAVGSALVTMDVLPRPAVRVEQLDDFFRFVERMFQFRRKQLQASLGRLLGTASRLAARQLEAVGIDPRLRAEQLSLPQWESLYGAVGQQVTRSLNRAGRR